MNHSATSQPDRFLCSSFIRPLTRAFGLMLALGLGAAHAASIVVDSSADGELGTLPDDCTLRAAVAAANAGDAVDGCSSGSFGADEIVFDPALAGATITLNAGEIEITSPLTITGPVAEDPDGIVLDGNEESRIFLVEGTEPSQFEVHLIGLTLTRGFQPFVDLLSTRGGAVLLDGADLYLAHVVVSHSGTDSAGLGGGGLAALNGNLILTDSLVAFNTTGWEGGGINIGTAASLTLLRTTVANNSGTIGGGVMLRFGTTWFTAIDSTISDNTASPDSNGGGGVYGEGGGATTYDLKNVIITGNSAGASGGGIYLVSGTSNLENITFSGNTSTGDGGGIRLDGGPHLITDSRISGNTIADGGMAAQYRGGGGIMIRNADVTIHRTSINDNVIEDSYGGGGLRGRDSIVLVTDSTISNNSKVGDPGQPGGGVFLENAIMTMINSTVSGNSSSGSGGGLSFIGSELTLLHTTVFGNSAANGADGIEIADDGPLVNVDPGGTIWLDHSLVVQTDPAEVACDLAEADEIHHSLALVTDASCTGTTIGLADLDIQPLADNGGLTLTHALGPDSVAIDVVPEEECTETDQRGQPRPGIGSSSCDIGAYEFQNLYTVGGTVTGLVGSDLVLQNNSVDTVLIEENGAFAFATSFPSGTSYNVEVLVQPTDPIQSCMVSNGSGTIDEADITDIEVICRSDEIFTDRFANQ